MRKNISKIINSFRKLPKKYVIEVTIATCVLAAVALISSSVAPSTIQEKYAVSKQNSSERLILHRAKVLSVSEKSLAIEILDGPSKGTYSDIAFESMGKNDTPSPGSTILVSRAIEDGSAAYFDRYRLPLLFIVVSVFILLVLMIGRRKGLRSLAGLGASVIVIGWIIVPLVIAGHNSLLVSVFGAYLIAVVSILIAHGFQRRTFISLICILAVLILVTIGSYLAVYLLGLSGVNDETGYYLQLDLPNLDLGGILIGGIVIAALGALDDIVTTQVATVDELKKANRNLTAKELYEKAFSVGGEHIAALVNTLALVYVGAALPLIVAYSVNTPDMLALFNSGFIVTEVIRTVIVSIGLVLAVPISTLLASTLLGRHYDAKS